MFPVLTSCWWNNIPSVFILMILFVLKVDYSYSQHIPTIVFPPSTSPRSCLPSFTPRSTSFLFPHSKEQAPKRHKQCMTKQFRSGHLCLSLLGKICCLKSSINLRNTVGRMRYMIVTMVLQCHNPGDLS